MKESNVQIQKEKINPFLLVMLTLFVVILVGSVLLFIDNGIHTNWANLSFESYINSFFISVSATCVTGLNSFTTGIVDAYSMFGQVIIMILIQIGGLGFLTVLAFLIVLFAGKLKFKDRHYISQIVGSTSIANVGKFVKKIILISFTIELAGFLIGIPAFLNLYSNTGEAIFKALFHSISSFNNAGFDLFGSQNMINSATNTVLANADSWAVIYIEILTMVLIILGGLGFIVIAEIFSFKKKTKQYSAFTKIVLLSTAVLLVGGSILFIFTECFKADNPMTPLQAIFQSVTCRTAGFATYDQENLSLGGKVISCLLMFIGGSPLSTAGGIKTTAIFMIILAMFSYLRGKRVAAFKRSFSSKQVIRAMSLAFVSIFVILTCYCGIYFIEDALPNGASTDNLFFEVFSAFGTVGLSANLTPELHYGSKLILCLLMFLGRLGPMTMFSIFSRNIDKEDDSHFKYVQSDILIG